MTEFKDLPLLLSNLHITQNEKCYDSWVFKHEKELKDVFLTIRNYKDYNFLNKCDLEKFQKFAYKYSHKGKTNY